MTQPNFASVHLYCEKTGCDRTQLHRHHKGHEYIWIAFWTKRRPAQPKFQKFAKRYWSFLEEDIVRLCPDHHAEIHEVYSPIIDSYIFNNGLLFAWSWSTAERLMKELRIVCDGWLKDPTSGVPRTRISEDD